MEAVKQWQNGKIGDLIVEESNSSNWVEEKPTEPHLILDSSWPATGGKYVWYLGTKERIAQRQLSHICALTSKTPRPVYCLPNETMSSLTSLPGSSGKLLRRIRTYLPSTTYQCWKA
jgi:hypothetical protein